MEWRRWKAAGLPILLLLGVVVGMTKALDSRPDGTVKELETKDMQDIMAGEGLWLVGYMQPDCEQCKQLVPILEEVAKELAPLGVSVGHVDVSNKKTAKLVSQVNIKTLPALHVFAGEARKNPYTGKMHREPAAFPPQKEARSRNIKKFVVDSIPNSVTAVTEKSFPEFVKAAAAKGLAVVLAFTNKSSTSPAFKAIALAYKDRLVFGEVSMSEDALTSAFSVEEAPAILVLPAPKQGEATNLAVIGERAERFEGKAQEVGEMKPFLDRFAAAEAVTSSEGEEEEGDASSGGAGKGKKKGGKAGEEAFNVMAAPKSRLLSEADFEKTVLKAEEAYVVYFKDAGAEEEVNEQWESVVAKSEGVVRAAHVHCSESPKLCKMYTAGASKFVSFPYGEEDKQEGGEVKAYDNPADALDDASDTVPSELVRRGDVSPTAIDQEVGQAMAAGKYPVIVLSRKSEAPLLVKSLALQLNEVVSFIFVADPSKALLQRFQDPAVPTMIVLLPATQQLSQGAMPPSNTPYNFKLAIYNPMQFGPLRYRTVLGFLMSVLQSSDATYAQIVHDRVFKQIKKGDSTSGGAQQADSSSSSSLSGGGGKLTAITQGQWSTAAQCSPTSSILCVIGFLAGEPSGDNTKYLDVLREVSVSEASAPLRFHYIDGICHAQFADAFDLQPPKLPTLVVYSAKKQRFATYIGSFSAEDVRGFLRGVLTGRITTGPVIRTPAVDEQCAITAGSRNASEEEMLDVVEEEEDIGDLMAEILQEEKRRKEELARQLKDEQEQKKREGEEEAQKKAAAAKKKKKAAAAKKNKKKANAKEL